jgi:CubicO group peptidase (beta-lactamase class C family)
MVTRGGSVVAELAEGLADSEAGAACTPETRFQLCSVSKQFAAVAVMLLVESGQLDLAEPVARWLPDWPPQWQRVTLHHLLSHTAGLPHWREAPGLDPAEPMPVGDRLEIIAATPLRAEPGARWHYSSLGFLLAACIVRRASGQPYPEFVAEHILSPLNLARTIVGGVPGAAALGYRDSQPVPPFDLDTMPGTGDIWSTAGDLTRFTIALHGGELITASSLDEMCTTHAAIDDDEGDGDDGDDEPRLTATGYGYGMFTGAFAGHPVYFHTGDNPGYLSLACWIPDLAASIVILANDEAARMERLVRQLLPAALAA